MEATIRKLVSGLAPRSPTLNISSKTLCRLVNTKSFSEPQIERILPVLFAHFDESRLPRDEDNSNYEPLGDPLIAASSINTIADFYITGKKALSRSMITKLTKLWPGLLEWLECCIQRGIENEYIPVAQRLEVKNIVVPLIGIYSNTSSPVLQSMITSDRSRLVPLVMRIWVQEYMEPRLHFLNSCCKGSHCDKSWKTNAAALLWTTFHATAKNDRSDLDAVFDAVPSYSRFIAHVALYSLRQNSRRRQIEHLGLNFAVDISVILSMSPHAALGRSLLAQGAVAAVTKALLINISRSKEVGYSLEDAQRGIKQCLYYLLIVFGLGNGITWITDALGAHFLLAVLECSRSSDKDIVGYCVEFLSKRLPPYLIYESVLVAAGRGVAYVEKNQSRIDGNVPQAVEEHWLKCKKLVHSGLELGGRVEADAIDLRRRQCDYLACDRTGLKLARCAGCMDTYYCSREHQKADWMHSHGEYCKQSQDFDRGHTPIPTLKDRVYLKVIILQLVDDRLPQITKLMEEEGIHAVLLQADFHFNPPTVTLTNAVTSPTPSGVTINGWTDTKSRWIRLLREHGTVQGRVLCVGVCPRGQITMPVMHAVDVTSMTIVG